jgi:DNA-directed DNA polymerase III PolC
MFGAEFIVRDGDNRPTCWALAEDTKELYKATTLGFKNKFWGATTTEEYMANSKGLIRFAGAALTDPTTFDYIDVNPGSAIQRAKSLQLAKKTKRPIVFTSDNYYPSPQDADLFTLLGRNKKPTPQYIMQELPTWVEKKWLKTADEIAERLSNVKLQSAPMIHMEGDVVSLAKKGKQYRLKAGHIACWTQEYEDRLQREIAMIKQKDFESYFLVVADLIAWAKKRMLVGPARGSSAGSLFCYLVGITEVDPIPHKLIFERFIDVTRKDLPDIDVDFPDSKRESVYEYLRTKYGEDCVARIGNVNTYKPNSALITISKALDIPPYETAALKNAMFIRSSGDSRANNCLQDTIEQTEPGKDFITRYPQIVPLLAIEGHVSHFGIHAAGVIVCNEPIENFATVQDGILQLDKKDAEKLNLLKIDALGLRTLSVIEDARIFDDHRKFYDLKFDDPAVFEIFNQHRYSGIFQWEGQALQSVTSQMHISTFADLDHITALARPGPLGGGAATRYIYRHEGKEGFDYPHPSMAEYLDETFGLVIYQEQVLRMCREIGQMSWDDVTLLRMAMSKSYGKEYFDQFGEKFVAGAATLSIDSGAAWAMWDQINSMGMWAFNKAHSVSYAIISYWTAWLKAHHPLSYTAAALRNAKDDSSVVSLLREHIAEGNSYVAFDIDKSEVNWSVQDGQLIGGFLNLHGFGPAKSIQAISKRKAGKLEAKDIERIQKAKNKFSELYPIRSVYAAYYDDPESKGIASGWHITELNDMPQSGEVLLLGKLVAKDLRDENEAIRVQRRGGKKRAGPSKFVDFKLLDDSTTNAITIRVTTRQYETIGEAIIQKAVEGQEVFMIRGSKIANYPMVKIDKIKCLTNPELFK